VDPKSQTKAKAERERSNMSTYIVLCRNKAKARQCNAKGEVIGCISFCNAAQPQPQPDPQYSAARNGSHVAAAVAVAAQVPDRKKPTPCCCCCYLNPRSAFCSAPFCYCICLTIKFLWLFISHYCMHKRETFEQSLFALFCSVGTPHKKWSQHLQLADSTANRSCW
jgi:hypothetical protein